MTGYNDSGQESTDREPTTDERRAEWEQFTIIVLDSDGGGYVNVRNDSYEDANDHIHSVHVEGGSADGCSCPHATYRDAHCKHQIAVENCPIVVASAMAANASTSQQVATDGGTVEDTNTPTDDTDTDASNTDGTNDTPHPQTDSWGQSVEHYDDGVCGAGEVRQCQSCGSRFEVALIAATADIGPHWQEFYRCQNCGVHGSFRVDERRDTRTWTGMIDYPRDA